MLALCAQRGCGIVLMHRLAPPGSDVFSHQYAKPPEYPPGVLAAVRVYLNERANAALRAGVHRDGVVLDPGLGFGKSMGQNLELIARTGEIAELGYPILSGISRKSFTAAAMGADPAEIPPRERVRASVGLSVAHLLAGARVFRVHDVREHVEALRAVARVTAHSEQHAAHIRAGGAGGAAASPRV
jgi:dihydropteroate synthase